MADQGSDFRFRLCILVDNLACLERNNLYILSGNFDHGDRFAIALPLAGNLHQVDHVYWKGESCIDTVMLDVYLSKPHWITITVSVRHLKGYGSRLTTTSVLQNQLQNLTAPI